MTRPGRPVRPAVSEPTERWRCVCLVSCALRLEWKWYVELPTGFRQQLSIFWFIIFLSPSLPPLPPACSPRPALMEKEIWGIMSWFRSIFVNLGQNYSPEEILLLFYQNTALSSIQFKHILLQTISQIHSEHLNNAVQSSAMITIILRPFCFENRTRCRLFSVAVWLYYR